MQTDNFFKYCAAVTDENYAELTAQQLENFTQTERGFVIQFVANTLASLTSLNCESIEEGEDYVTRLTDAQEVMHNLHVLYNTFEDDAARLTFTLADAGAAICSYDTEYRECIAEQFEEACNDAAKLQLTTLRTDCDFSTLALRVMCSY